VDLEADLGGDIVGAEELEAVDQADVLGEVAVLHRPDLGLQVVPLAVAAGRAASTSCRTIRPPVNAILMAL
jgi:hypothetical protein